MGSHSALSFVAFILCCSPAYRGCALLRTWPDVLFSPQPPCRAQSACQDIFIRRSQANVGHSHPSPATCNGHEHVRLLLTELGLLFRREHQVAVTLLLRGERGEYPAPDTEVRRPHMRSLFHALQAQGNPAKIRGSHSRFLPWLLGTCPIPHPRSISSPSGAWDSICPTTIS